MNINVTVDDVTLDSVVGEAFGGFDSEGEPHGGGPITLRDAVVDQIAERVVRDHGRSYDLQRIVQEERTAVIRERLAPIVDDAMSGTIRKTNGYGEPTGPEVTMREVVIDQVKGYLTEKVDKEGRSGRDSYSGDRTTPRLQYLLHRVVKEVIAAELADEIAAAKAAMRSQLQAVVAAELAKVAA